MFVPTFPNAGYRISSTETFRGTNTRTGVLIIGGLSPTSVGRAVSGVISLVGRDRVIVLPNKFSNNSRPRNSNGFVTAAFEGPGIGRTISGLLGYESNLVLNVYGNFRTLVGLNLIPCNGVIRVGGGSPALAFGAVNERVSSITCAEITDIGSP